MKGKRAEKKIIRQASTYLKRSSPIILACIGAVGVVATAVLAVRATPKALEILEDEKEFRREKLTPKEPLTWVEVEPLTKKEVFLLTWKCFIPAAATGMATIACIFGANVLNHKQQASLTSAYALVSRQFRDYKNKVKEIYGREAHEKIMSSLAVEKTDAPCIYGSMSGKDFDFGEVDEEQRLFYDAFSERYFQATITQVLLAEYHVNRNFALNGGEIGVDNFYKFLGLETPEELKDLCWFVSDYYYFIDFTHTKAMVDDGLSGEVECWIIEMDFPPTIEALEY